MSLRCIGLIGYNCKNVVNTYVMTTGARTVAVNVARTETVLTGAVIV